MVRTFEKAMHKFADTEKLKSISDWLRLTALRTPGPEDRLSDTQDVHSFANDGRTPSVLCLHGFGGVPSEVKLVGDVAESLGLKVRGPLMAGHGTHPEDLAETCFSDWVESARPHFDELRAEGPVFLAGLSMGSLVATQLALENPGAVAGLILLSSAFTLRSPFPALLLDLVDRFGVPDFYVPKGPSDIRRAAGQTEHVSYHLQPVHAAVSLLRAGQKLSSELHRLHKPILQVHGARDHVCPLEPALKLARELRSAQRSFIVLPNSGHIITRDLDQDALVRELNNFFGQHTSG